MLYSFTGTALAVATHTDVRRGRLLLIDWMTVSACSNAGTWGRKLLQLRRFPVCVFNIIICVLSMRLESSKWVSITSKFMCLEPQSIVSRSTAGMSCETCRAAAELSLGTVAMAWATSDTPGAYVRMDSSVCVCVCV